MTDSDTFAAVVPVSETEVPTAPVAPSADSYDPYTLPGRRFAQVTAFCLVLNCFVVVALLLPQARPVVVPLCLSLVAIVGVALVSALGLTAAGASDVPLAPGLAGVLLILGGAACDIYATIRHSPDLRREANPVLRGLLDEGVSLAEVYGVGAIMQVGFVGLSLTLWLGLLRHRHTLAATMPAEGSLLTFFKAGTGGRELSYRQWCCPLSYSELPWAYQFCWWCGVAFLATGVYRFYLALEWYGVAPFEPMGVRLVAPTALLFLASAWYALWLRNARARLTATE